MLGGVEKQVWIWRIGKGLPLEIQCMVIGHVNLLLVPGGETFFKDVGGDEDQQFFHVLSPSVVFK